MTRRGRIRSRITTPSRRQQQIDRALDVAQGAKTTWANTPISTRQAVLVASAEHLARYRADLIGVMMLDGGKRATEADTEVSEAIDFANYYARSLDIADTALADCTFEPFGVVLVTPPWNFPLAIPCGGVLAAVMAGNVVLLKPAPEAVLVGWKMCQVLWEAGIPREVLQFVPTTDDAGRASAGHQCARGCGDFDRCIRHWPAVSNVETGHPPVCRNQWQKQHDYHGPG